VNIVDRDWGLPGRLIRQRLGIAESTPARDILPTLWTRPVPDSRHIPLEAPPSGPMAPLAEIATGSKGRPFLKWWHYFDAYEQQLGDLARRSREGLLDRPVRLLEMGIWRGGFLNVWREYFGPDAIIYGIDIDSAVATLGVTSAEVRVGSQDDAGCLGAVVDEMGGLDVVIDDGSHISEHVLASLRILYPKLSDGGIYCIEDLHTSYWPEWGGGLRRRGSSIEVLKQLIDGLNQPYFDQPAQANDLGIDHGNLASITFADSMAFLRKRLTSAPRPFHGGIETPFNQ